MNFSGVKYKSIELIISLESELKFTSQNQSIWPNIWMINEKNSAIETLGIDQCKEGKLYIKMQPEKLGIIYITWDDSIIEQSS